MKKYIKIGLDINRKKTKRRVLPLTFFVLCVYFLLQRSSPAGQSRGGDEEGQQGGEEAEVGHRQHESYEKS